MSPAKTAASQRPRVEGDRELEILAAALEVLADVGYDRLTMDAVATRAKASKATLYRRWSSKARLVIDALLTSKSPPPDADTGSLRGDLLAVTCCEGGLCDQDSIGLFAGIVTAICRDQEFAEIFRTEVVAAKAAGSRAIWERARQRGELRDDIDLELLEPALAGIVLHRVFVEGEPPSQELITKVIDQIILPAVSR
ncbi:MAG: TetR/AcrR family transcriptional regulator [Nocardioides sp.]|nr:TetR/AcrR family transcriptional regulator [Nocardioides sp.]